MARAVLTVGGALTGTLLAPSLGQACAVCFGNENTDWTAAFVAGTVVMMSLPPLLVGGLGFVIYRSAKKTAEKRTLQEQAGSPVHPTFGAANGPSLGVTSTAR